ncbi:MAG TPA: hypothetical protein VH500_17715 [Nitrososphaeraceae archaeon]|jgi:hypothetical protein
MAQNPIDNQFTIEELNVIHDALVFTLSCIDSREGQIQRFKKMKLVLAKVAGLIKQV